MHFWFCIKKDFIDDNRLIYVFSITFLIFIHTFAIISVLRVVKMLISSIFQITLG